MKGKGMRAKVKGWTPCEHSIAALGKDSCAGWCRQCVLESAVPQDEPVRFTVPKDSEFGVFLRELEKSENEILDIWWKAMLAHWEQRSNAKESL